MPNSKKRTIIRAAIILFGVFLFLQFRFASFDEPYPAILLPSFAGIYSTGDEVTFTNYEIYAFTNSGDSIRIEKADLFKNVPPVFYHGVIDNIKRRQKGVHQAKPVKLGIFNFQLVMDLRADFKKTVQFKKWIKNNLLELPPSYTYRQVKLYNNEYTFDVAEDKLTVKRRLIEPLIISLTD